MAQRPKITRAVATKEERTARRHKARVNKKIIGLFELINLKNSWSAGESSKLIYPNKKFFKLATDTARLTMVRKILQIHYALYINKGIRPPELVLMSPTGVPLTLWIQSYAYEPAVPFHVGASYMTSDSWRSSREVDTSKYKDSWFLNTINFTSSHQREMEDAVIQKIHKMDRDSKANIALDVIERRKIRVSLEDTKRYFLTREYR